MAQAKPLEDTALALSQMQRPGTVSPSRKALCISLLLRHREFPPPGGKREKRGFSPRPSPSRGTPAPQQAWALRSSPGNHRPQISPGSGPSSSCPNPRDTAEKPAAIFPPATASRRAGRDRGGPHPHWAGTEDGAPRLSDDQGASLFLSGVRGICRLPTWRWGAGTFPRHHLRS